MLANVSISAARPVYSAVPAPQGGISPAEPAPGAKPEPRDTAAAGDFGYAADGTPAAAEFFDRLEAELAGPERVARAAKYLERPDGVLIKTYGELLRTGANAAAAAYGKTVIATFRDKSPAEGRRIDIWLTHVSTFLRRSADLMALSVQSADPNILPFVREAVEQHIDRGLLMLQDRSGVPPLTTTVDDVLQQARDERTRRLAEIETFFEKAQSGGSIVGVPCVRDGKTAWLRDGRFIFQNLDDALAMAPRPVFVTYFNLFPANDRLRKEIQYGPHQIHGPRPASIEYVDKTFVRRFWHSDDSNIARLSTDADPDYDHEKDGYRIGDGPWTTFPRSTTLELELHKAIWYFRLHEQARAAWAS